MPKGIIIPKIAPHCTGDGCEMPGEHICAKCGTMVCEFVAGIIGDDGMHETVKRFRNGHAVYCLYCRFTAKPHVYCVGCAGDHELMLSFRGSCRTAYRALHETSYQSDADGGVEGRSEDNATEMSERRTDKYKKMDSTNPAGAKLIRPEGEQEIEVETKVVKGPDGKPDILTIQKDTRERK